FTRFQNQGVIKARGREVELMDLGALQMIARDPERQSL
ncbi:MAG TPA: Crp/Fnr family transcriptional regulator, partial [Marinobacter sp.]|nr:Crp/Fnr family transcriptional regulator [Marinobacter sp.]